MHKITTLRFIFLSTNVLKIVEKKKFGSRQTTSMTLSDLTNILPYVFKLLSLLFSLG